MKNITTFHVTKLQHTFSRDRPPGEEYTSGMNRKAKKRITHIPTPVFAGEVFTHPQEENDQAWEKAILRRLDEMRSGKVKGVTRAEMDASDVLAREKYKPC